MAIAHRRPPITLHSDQGSTYATGSYREIVNRYGIRQSMSRKGDCWDNAPMESFFHTLKTELVMHRDYKPREDAPVSEEEGSDPYAVSAKSFEESYEPHE